MIELIFFSGRNCSVCKVLKPKLFEALKNYTSVKTQIIIAEDDPKITAQHLVFTLPVVLILFDHKEYYRFIRSFSVDEVIEKLDKIIAFTQM